MNVKKKVDEITKGTQINKILHQLNHKFEFMKYRVQDVSSGRYDGGLFSYDGLYNIKPEPQSIPSFWYPCHVGKNHRRDRVLGKYESEVMDYISREISEEDTFWEVGAWRGWYSLALAPVVNEVVAFEAREHPIRELDKAIIKNKYENVSTVNDVVQSLDEYAEKLGEPTIVLMDIEGWEYDALSDSLKTIKSVQPTFIIEIHGKETGWSQGKVVNPRGIEESVDTPNNVNPEGVKELLKDHGYSVETINIRRETHHHILAKPET